MVIMLMSSAAPTVRRLWASAPPLLICASFATVAAALSIPVVPFDGGGYRSDTTIYPIWVWALAIAGFVAGLISLAARPAALKSAAASVALVAAMPLAGTGVVARKHWDPSFGHGGNYGTGYGSLGELQTMAVLIAAAAVVGAVAAIAQLHFTGAFPSRVEMRIRALSVCLGLVVIVALTLVVKNGDYQAGDLTSWGAFGLMYAGPWGTAIIATAWLDRPAAVAALASVCGCVLLAAVGPQMTWFFYPDPTGPFVATLTAPLLVLAARLHQRSGSHVAIGT
jgi:hypothetical protein